MPQAVDLQKLQAWIQSKFPAPPQCPLCDSIGLVPSPEIIWLVRAFDEKNSAIQSNPHVGLGCQNCGHVMFLSAKLIGLV